ncbi:hypothetical protein IMCC3317_28410 [Kordia antarctica]|uniref:Fibronectin type-III domain-containing protein n=1 Tax=Kordia antarctica TaxID=1218801 RepID=A0A7L4ZLE8_9FLAO|nr:hypothetical protein [Kordia antarctica]QHI37462.1 hypothetical protein IMCC3317_28410 [Kordia antarctica]
MKKFSFTLLTVLLILSSCTSSDENSENTNTNQNPVNDFSTLQVNFDLTAEEGSCFDLTYANSACRDHICIKWNSVQGADNYKVFASDAINGTYTLLETVTETYYSSVDFEFNTPYFFYVVAYSNIHGDGLASETLELERCQTYVASEVITSIVGPERVNSTDLMNNKLFVAYETNNGGSNLLIIDASTGSLLSMFNNSLFNDAKLVRVNSNEDIYVLDNNHKRIRRFNSQTQDVYSESIQTSVRINHFDVDKIQNRLFINKQNSLTIEVYDADFNVLTPISISADYNRINGITYGADNKLYILVSTVASTKNSLLVYSSQGVLLNVYTEPFADRVTKIFQVDSQGHLYSLEWTSTEYLIKHVMEENSINIISSITQMTSYPTVYNIVSVDDTYNVFIVATNHSANPLKIIKFEPSN